MVEETDVSVVRQLWADDDRTQHAKNAEEAMCRAREAVGVPPEEWAPMLAVQVRRLITAEDTTRWEVGLGSGPPGDVLMAAAYLSFLSIHDLIGSAEFVRKMTDLEARMEVLDGRHAR